MKEIYFAGGCFWGTEHFFSGVDGVESAVSGYAQGRPDFVGRPSYEQVYTDTTGFAETVKVSYRPEIVSLKLLAELFFDIIDPLSLNRQGHDTGTRYRTGIYYDDPAALIYERMKFFWVGFYIVHGSELVLGPFQGPPACLRIAYGRGVCGTAWKEARTVIVPDVETFPGHIACSSLSRSEIVVPVVAGAEGICAVLDIDSTSPSAFDSTDALWLGKICALL